MSYSKNRLFVGTYTNNEYHKFHVDGKGEGVILLEFEKENGRISRKSVVSKIVNPSYIAVSGDGKYLYTVSESDTPGSVYSYEIKKETNRVDDDDEDDEDEVEEDKEGGDEHLKLKLINSLRMENDGAMCHILIHHDKYVFITSYMGPSILMFSIQPNDGGLVFSDRIVISGPHGPNEVRQEQPHAHSSIVVGSSSSNSESQICLLLVADLGCDRIWMFSIDYESGKLKPNPSQEYLSLRPGCGPRHFCSSSSSSSCELLFVINELDSTISPLLYDQKEKKLEVQGYISTLPAHDEEVIPFNICADIHIHPNGKFLYGSNRGHNSIVVFEIIINTNNKEKDQDFREGMREENKMELKLLQHVSTRGIFPRSFIISKEEEEEGGHHLLVANEKSDNIEVFLIAGDNKNNNTTETGKLEYSGISYNVKTPVSLAWVGK